MFRQAKGFKNIPKLNVAGSNPVSRSTRKPPALLEVS